MISDTRLKILLSTLLLLCFNFSFATHNRAGEVIYQLIAPFTYTATIITYTKESSVAADRDSLTIDWGDGTQQTLLRGNGTAPFPGGIPAGQPLGNDIKKNMYTGTHAYPGAPPPPRNYYVISMFDMNRIGGITNIDGGNSVNVPFYIEDTLWFRSDLANIGFNSSPILLYPPIDYANVNDTFYHNPVAFDPDGDSLDFQLTVPLQVTGLTVPNYIYPNQYIPGPNNNFTLNRRTGELIWAVPPAVGIFNIAILIREYRRGILLGTLVRDMQIIVDNQNNSPPRIQAISDTCVRAGDLLQIQVSARDPDPGQLVELSARGGPLEVLGNPASLPTATGNPVQSTFRWQTVCEHIRSQPYQVVFRAQDNYVSPGGAPIPLVDLQSLNIHVIAPPPDTLEALVLNANTVRLDWSNPYVCASFTNFRGFSVWRKIASNPFVPDYCETGLAGQGYTRIANRLNAYSFTDNTVVPGLTYCYRILAHFSQLSPNGILEYDQVESVASNEACINLPLSVPVITKVSVRNTDPVSGSMQIEWTRPLTGPDQLDTLRYPPPYRFQIFRGSGFGFSSPQLISTTAAAFSYSALLDTTFTDSLINTEAGPFSYRIGFFSGTDTVGFSSAASSVFLILDPTDRAINLSWNYQTPWLNDSFTVYRKNNISGIFDSIALMIGTQSFRDEGLINDTTYCYYIRSWGHYTDSILPRPLINLSQIACAKPVDTIPPCMPVLTVANDCPLYEEKPWGEEPFINRLSWTIEDPACLDDIWSFRIYYSPDTSGFILLDTISGNIRTTFEHTVEVSLAACYRVTAVDRVGNESADSVYVCTDNCPYYKLPNTFTPNGDGSNDLYTPRKPYRFVSRLDFSIYNRWGEKVFETTDPEIRWDGKHYKTGKELPEGTYLYGGYLFQQRLGREISLPLPGTRFGDGFIHLFRGN